MELEEYARLSERDRKALFKQLQQRAAALNGQLRAMQGDFQSQYDSLIARHKEEIARHQSIVAELTKRKHSIGDGSKQRDKLLKRIKENERLREVLVQSGKLAKTMRKLKDLKQAGIDVNAMLGELDE